MKKLLLILSICCAIALVTQAEDLYHSGKIGFYASADSGLLNFSQFQNMYPMITIGVSLHLNPQWALRPGATFFLSQESDVDDPTRKTGSTLAIGGGADILAFVNLGENAALFFSLGGWYTFITDKDYYASGEVDDDSQTHYLIVPLKLGGQYLFTKNFGFFVDIGFSYKFSKSYFVEYDAAGTITSEDNDNAHYWSLTPPTFGAVFYFN